MSSAGLVVDYNLHEIDAHRSSSHLVSMAEPFRLPHHGRTRHKSTDNNVTELVAQPRAGILRRNGHCANRKTGWPRARHAAQAFPIGLRRQLLPHSLLALSLQPVTFWGLLILTALDCKRMKKTTDFPSRLSVGGGLGEAVSERGTGAR